MHGPVRKRILSYQCMVETKITVSCVIRYGAQVRYESLGVGAKLPGVSKTNDYPNNGVIN